jgi:hypothetical protein
VDRGVAAEAAAAAASVTALAQMRFWPAHEAEQRATTLADLVDTELGSMG